MKSITAKFTALSLALSLIFASLCFGGTAYAADVSSESDDVKTITVSTVDGLQDAFEDDYDVIYLESGTTYEIPSGFTIPEDTTLIGEDGVVFDTADNLTSGLAGLYITNDGVKLENITIMNNSDAEKPPVKIEADDVTLENCVILNYAAQSALVIHASAGVELKNCAVSNCDDETSYMKNVFAVIQVNAGSSVTVTGGSVETATKYQPHIVFEYGSASYYANASTLIFDENLNFEGGYSDVATIYSAAPMSVGRADVVKVLTSSYPAGLQLSTTIESGSDYATTKISDEVSWYYYNVEDWTSFLSFSYDGCLYTNTNSSSVLTYIKLGLLAI